MFFKRCWSKMVQTWTRTGRHRSGMVPKTSQTPLGTKYLFSETSTNHDTATGRKILRNDVWTTHLVVSVSASGLVSIVFGLVNDDLKHHVGLVHTWEHPAFNFVSNPTLFVTRTTLHNSPSRHKQCVADWPQNGVG